MEIKNGRYDILLCKPFHGDIRNGVRLRINVAHHSAVCDPSYRYEELLNAVAANKALQRVLQEQWELAELPEIRISECVWAANRFLKHFKTFWKRLTNCCLIPQMISSMLQNVMFCFVLF